MHLVSASPAVGARCNGALVSPSSLQVSLDRVEYFNISVAVADEDLRRAFLFLVGFFSRDDFEMTLLTFPLMVEDR